MSSPLRSNPLLKVAPVPTGSTVCIISPASFAMPDRLERGMARLLALGFASRPGVHTQSHGPLYFAGTPSQRIDDLHAAFTSDENQLIACVRGGYGSNYLLDSLDLDLIRAHPRPFIAYSDLTGIQLHLLDRIGLPAFHGPMVAADFYLDDGAHIPSFLSALAGETYSVGAAEGMRVLRPGTAEGTLYGGCLSILASLLGTPWEPETEGKLLFLEDTGVKPYQIDRLLWQLRHAGKFAGIRGVIFGEMLDCSSPGASPNLLDDTIRHAFSDFDIPIVIGLRSGHVSSRNVTLTFGVQSRLHAAEQASLQMLQPAVTG